MNIVDTGPHTHTITHSGCCGGVADNLASPVYSTLPPPVMTVAGAVFLALSSYAEERADGMLMVSMDEEDDETGLRCEVLITSGGKEARLDLDHLFYLAFTDVEAAYRIIDVTVAMLPSKSMPAQPSHSHYGIGWTSPNGIFGSLTGP